MIKNGYLGRQAERIYHELHENIKNGLFKPGSQLPTEKELCRRFSCSNLTLRKALKKLSEENKIESRRGSGSFVKTDIYRNTLYGNNNHSNVIAIMYLGDISTLTELQDVALQHKFMLTVYSQNREHWSSEKEREFFLSLLKQRPKALLAFCSPRQPYNDDLLFQLQNNGTQVIHIGVYKTQLPETSFILPDYHRAGYTAAITFMLRGYKYFYYLGMDNDGPFATLQKQGFYQALNEHCGHSPEEQPVSKYGKNGNYLIIPKFGIDSETEIDRLLHLICQETGKPAGIFCSTPDRAQRLREIVLNAGLRVPEDIGIITCGNVNYDSQDIPKTACFSFNRLQAIKKAITTISQPDFNCIHQLLIPKLTNHNKTLLPLKDKH